MKRGEERGDLDTVKHDIRMHDQIPLLFHFLWISFYILFFFFVLPYSQVGFQSQIIILLVFLVDYVAHVFPTILLPTKIELMWPYLIEDENQSLAETTHTQTHIII